MTKLGLRGAGVLSLQLALTLFAACSSFDDSAGPAPGSQADAGDGGVLTGDAQSTDTSLRVAAFEEIRITQGTTATVDVKLTRGAALKGPVTVTVEGLRDGIVAAPLSIDGAEGKLSVNVPLAAPQGKADCTLVATAGDVKVTAPLPLFVRGPAGSLDTTFGEGGFAYPPAPTYGRWVFPLPKNGGYIVAGLGDSTAMVSRLLADGTLDTTYGDAGVAKLATTLPQWYGQALLQPDGKVLLTYHNYIGRLDATGQPDSSFGNGVVGTGTAKIDGPVPDENGIIDLAVRPDGDIVLAYTSSNDAKTATFVGATRLSPTGAVRSDYVDGFTRVGLKDTSNAEIGGIGIGLGLRLDPKSPDYGDFFNVAVQDGYYGIIQQLPTGALDTTFQDGGRRTVALASADSNNIGVVQLYNGTVIAPISGPDTEFRLVSFLRNGDPDPSFGTNGVAGPYPVVREPTGIALGKGGTVLVAIPKVESSEHILLDLRRYRPDGSPDPSFGDNGQVVVEDPTDPAAPVQHIAVQEDGRIVVLLFRQSAAVTTALARFWD